jgi:hypothetical protein
MHRNIRAAAVAVVFAVPLLQAVDKLRIAKIGYGDLIDTTLSRTAGFSSKSSIEKTLTKIRADGYTAVYWRMFWEGHPARDIISFNVTQMQQFAAAAKDFENTPYAWDPHEIRWPSEVTHRLGMKFYAWIVPYNEGVLPGAYLQHGIATHKIRFAGEQPPFRFPYWRAIHLGEFSAYETDFPYITKFVYVHPEYQSIDRQQRTYHEGILEWAYPEARKYWIDDVKLILDKYDIDGVYVDTRTELMSPEHADYYGFNKPVVEEFQKRYGVNILEEDFDVELWRGLRGEHFTLFLKELAQVLHGRGKALSLGTSRGDYIGFPLGNMKLEWRRWITEKIVDELVFEPHGWGWGRQGYGYVTDFATARGLRPLETMVREDYYPVASTHGAKLVIECRPYVSRPSSDECCSGRATVVGSVQYPANWCEIVTKMPEFSGTAGYPDLAR